MPEPLMQDDVVEKLECFEGFAITMLRAFLVGLELNKAHHWSRASSDETERMFVAALQDYRAALTSKGE
jgi:hypothetical protein